MDCRSTSTKRRARGFTLVEFLVSGGVAVLLAVALAGLVFYTNRSFTAMANYVSLDHQSRITLDTMSREIRQTKRLISSSETSLTFEDHDAGTLQYVYDASARTLKRIKNGVPGSKPLLKECDYLKFSIFQRNPVGGTYNQFPAATASTCKLVQLHWVCSRTILGAKVNTESVQSAKIVIRKQ